jgi:hypothetical protein
MTNLYVGQRVSVAGWPAGKIEMLHTLGQVVTSVRIRLDTGAVLIARPDEIAATPSDNEALSLGAYERR